MSRTTLSKSAKNAWQTPRNHRTLQALMALENQEIARRIAELRKARGNPPQDVVARKLGVGPRTYQAWELGEARPGYSSLEKLATYFGTTEEHILTGMGEPPTSLGAQMNRIEQKLDDLLGIFTSRPAEGSADEPGAPLRGLLTWLQSQLDEAQGDNPEEPRAAGGRG